VQQSAVEPRSSRRRVGSEAAEQGVEADEAWLTPELRSLTQCWTDLRRSNGVAIRVVATCILGLTLSACSASEEPFPEVRGRQAPEPCLKPLPPPSFVVRQGSDSAHCVSEAGRTSGVEVQVIVSSDGRAISIQQGLDLCLTVGPDGVIQERYELSGDEKRCILGALEDWRFAGVDTCWPVTTSITIGATHARRRQQTARGSVGAVQQVDEADSRRTVWVEGRLQLIHVLCGRVDAPVGGRR
jgi:hypothetical protein